MLIFLLVKLVSAAGEVHLVLFSEYDVVVSQIRTKMILSKRKTKKKKK